MPFRTAASAHIAKVIQALGGVECEVAGKRATLDNAVARVVRALRGSVSTTWLFGNGGSGTIADHIACDLMLASHAAQALTNPALASTMANDFGIETMFSLQLKYLVRPSDIMIGMSCSGESANVLAGMGAAVSQLKVGLTGFKRDNSLTKAPLDVMFWVPSDEYGPVQIVHLAILHAIVDLLKEPT